MTFDFDNTYARLPGHFYVRQAPEPVAEPRLLRLNEPLAEALGLDPARLGSRETIETLAGNRLPEGSDPLAMAYAGHQFGNFVPRLGDGRAILLGEILDPRGRRFDIQLKGCGRTSFSRGGDGRAWVGPVLREYIVGEAMHALGIPTTRALAAVSTGEPIYREQPLPGAVLTRVARGHVRIGTFEYFSARDDDAAIRRLADYVIARHYPEAADTGRPYRALLDSVIAGQADLVARWLAVGFIHGVMNTDNMAIACETIDYGPCAFIDAYHPGTVYSSIDRQGRYAYANQPRIAQWNLARLAQCLLPILDDDDARALGEAQAAIDAFPELFEQAWLARFRAKLGIESPEPDDAKLIQGFMDLLATAGADFTNSFRALCDAAAGDEAAIRSQIADGERLTEWLQRWHERLADEAAARETRGLAMRKLNPAVIPRNHRVEAALDAAVRDDLAPLDDLLQAVTSPWEDGPLTLDYRRPPEPHEVVRQTFCGT